MTWYLCGLLKVGRPVTEPWGWWHGHGSEPEYFTGPFDTHAAASEEARECYDDDCCGFTIVYARHETLSNDIFYRDAIEERFNDTNEDRRHPDGGDSLLDATHAEWTELERQLAETFGRWRLKYALGRTWSLKISRDEYFPPAEEESDDGRATEESTR